MATASRQRRLFMLVIVLAVVQLALVGARATLTIRGQDAIPSAPAIDALDLPAPAMALTIQSGVDRANTIAASWSDHAVLSFASMQIDWPTDAPPATVTSVPPFGWIRLLYVSPIDNGPSDYAALSLMFERVSGRLVDARVTQWDVAPPSTGLLDGISVNENTAVLATEIDSGTVYRSACPDRRNETTVSITRDPTTDEPVWSLNYDENGRNAGGSLLVEVNARSGQLSLVRPAAEACAAVS